MKKVKILIFIPEEQDSDLRLPGLGRGMEIKIDESILIGPFDVLAKNELEFAFQVLVKGYIRDKTQEIIPAILDTWIEKS